MTVSKKPQLTLARHNFLGFFLAGPPDRAVWLGPKGQHLGWVAEPFGYHPQAEAVKVYRLASDGDQTFQGDAIGRRVLSVEDLRALEPLWTVPLRELNAHGLALAKAPAPQPLSVISFKAPWEVEQAWKAEARAKGITLTALILDRMERQPNQEGV